MENEMLEPTLDSCCQREIESNRHRNAVDGMLRQHDVVAQKERRRRHLVFVPDQFTGCRCVYDPNSDGGEYRSLDLLRAKRKSDEIIVTEYTSFEEKKEDAVRKSDETGDDDDDDDDDEFDYLLDDLPGNEELKMLDERRRAELEFEMLRIEVATQHGFGVLRHMHPSRILRAAGVAPGTRDPPFAVVLHLVDHDSVASASLDLHLESLAPKFGRGTKFMRSFGRTVLILDADLVAQVLPKLHLDRDLPALVAIREGVVVNVCRGLREFSVTGDCNDEIVPDVVTEWLVRCGVLIDRIPQIDEMCRIRPEEEALMEYITTEKPNTKVQEPIFNCGVPDCSKSYFHEHVGLCNEQQDGLLVPEQDVIGSAGEQD